MSVDIAAELRSWCIDHHLPSGASECLLCEAAQTVELFREELYQLARLATGGWEGEASWLPVVVALPREGARPCPTPGENS